MTAPADPPAVWWLPGWNQLVRERNGRLVDEFGGGPVELPADAVRLAPMGSKVGRDLLAGYVDDEPAAAGAVPDTGQGAAASVEPVCKCGHPSHQHLNSWDFCKAPFDYLGPRCGCMRFTALASASPSGDTEEEADRG